MKVGSADGWGTPVFLGSFRLRMPTVFTSAVFPGCARGMTIFEGRGTTHPFCSLRPLQIRSASQ